jgi:hypothetical protein
LKTGKAKKKDSNTDMHAMIAAAVAASTKASAATTSEGDNELKTQIKALVSSLEAQNATPAGSDSSVAVGSTTAAVPPVSIKGILNKAKHG